jgi:Fur family ferric uptake transcriptional regulator
MSQPFALGNVEVSLTPQARFEEFLQSRGKRMTQQRRAIVDFVFSRHDHFDADNLLVDLRKAGHGRLVSRPTVYRTLSELVNAGLLREITRLNGRSVFEHDYGYPRHDHLHCEKCDKLIEFHSEELDKLREAVAREYQFRAVGHRFIIHGVCAACARTRTRNRRLELV